MDEACKNFFWKIHNLGQKEMGETEGIEETKKAIIVKFWGSLILPSRMPYVIYINHYINALFYLC